MNCTPKVELVNSNLKGANQWKEKKEHLNLN